MYFAKLFLLNNSSKYIFIYWYNQVQQTLHPKPQILYLNMWDPHEFPWCPSYFTAYYASESALLAPLRSTVRVRATVRIRPPSTFTGLLMSVDWRCRLGPLPCVVTASKALRVASKLMIPFVHWILCAPVIDFHHCSLSIYSFGGDLSERAQSPRQQPARASWGLDSRYMAGI